MQAFAVGVEAFVLIIILGTATKRKDKTKIIMTLDMRDKNRDSSIGKLGRFLFKIRRLFPNYVIE